ncbi:unnamed protein product [Closterium sp. Naga37s-1]|nr:unnamed protein product [Closterium sp. Naga37s-1]
MPTCRRFALLLVLLSLSPSFNVSPTTSPLAITTSPVTTSPVTVATAAKVIGVDRVTYKQNPNEEEKIEAASGKIKAPVQALTVPTLRKTVAEHSRVLVVFFNKEDKAFPLLVDDVSGAKAELTKLGLTVAMVDGVAAGESVREDFKAYGDMPNFVLVRDGGFRPIRGYPESHELIAFVKKRLGLSVTHLSASEAHKAHSLLTASNAIALLHSLKVAPSPSRSCTPSRLVGARLSLFLSLCQSQSLNVSSAVALGLLHSLTAGWCASILLSLLLVSARLSLLISLLVSLLVSLPARLPVSQPPAPHTHKAHSLLAAFSTIAVALLHSLKFAGGRASMKKAQGAVVFRTDDPLASCGGRASMKKAQGAVVFRTDDPLAGRDYRPAMPGDNPDFWEGSHDELITFVKKRLGLDELITFVKKRLGLSVTHLSASEAHKAHSLLAASNAIALTLLHSLKVGSQSLAASSTIALGLLHSLTVGWCCSLSSSLSPRLSLLVSLSPLLSLLVYLSPRLSLLVSLSSSLFPRLSLLVSLSSSLSPRLSLLVSLPSFLSPRLSLLVSLSSSLSPRLSLSSSLSLLVYLSPRLSLLVSLSPRPSLLVSLSSSLCPSSYDRSPVTQPSAPHTHKAH